MMPHLLKNFLLFALLLGTATLTPTPANSTGNAVLPYKMLLTGELYITFPSSGTANMSWTPISGTSLYFVEIYDLTASQPVTSFYTGNTYATVSNLPVGHNCRFSVTKGSENIIIDAIVQ